MAEASGWLCDYAIIKSAVRHFVTSAITVNLSITLWLPWLDVRRMSWLWKCHDISRDISRGPVEAAETQTTRRVGVTVQPCQLATKQLHFESWQWDSSANVGVKALIYHVTFGTLHVTAGSWPFFRTVKVWNQWCPSLVAVPTVPN